MMLYPFWHELVVRFLDCVVIGILFLDLCASLKRRPEAVQVEPVVPSVVPVHDYAREAVSQLRDTP